MEGESVSYLSGFLKKAFVKKARPAVRSCVEADPQAESILSDAFNQAIVAHPSFAVDATEFLTFLGERAVEGNSADDILGSLFVADLLLVFACLREDPHAVAKLQSLLRSEFARAGRRVGSTDSMNDEALQSLSALMLTGEGEPGLVRYAGRGSLIGFLRVAATRTLMRLQASERRWVPLPEHELAETVAGLPDPEVELIKARYRSDFNDAFRQAMQALTCRERAVLRLHLVGGLSIDAIGKSYQVHRSTVARWVAEARTKLLDETQRVLMGRLNLQPADARSLARMLRSQLDPGLMTILREFK